MAEVGAEANGGESCDNGDKIFNVSEYGVATYSLTLLKRIEKQTEVRHAKEAARRNQTLRSVLVSPSRDYVISSDGTKVPVSDLEGKIVAMYFANACHPWFVEFTPILAQIYEKLKERGEKFEVVLVYRSDDESSFVEMVSSMPWLALPFEGNSREEVALYFSGQGRSSIVIIDADGKTLGVDFADLLEEHGEEAIEAFPFEPEKLELLAEKAKAKLEAQTLESLFISGDLDFVIGKENVKVPVKDLAGKYILLYFSTHYRPELLPELVEAYHEIKNKDDAFEIIFISSDYEESSFDEFYSKMPWLALPFRDARMRRLSRTFEIRFNPSFVAVGPPGRKVTNAARRHYGADAYPFSVDRIAELERQIDKILVEQGVVQVLPSLMG